MHDLDGYANFADVWNRDHGHSALYDPRAALMDELGTAAVQAHGTLPRALNVIFGSLWGPTNQRTKRSNSSSCRLRWRSWRSARPRGNPRKRLAGIDGMLFAARSNQV